MKKNVMVFAIFSLFFLFVPHIVWGDEDISRRFLIGSLSFFGVGGGVLADDSVFLPSPSGEDGEEELLITNGGTFGGGVELEVVENLLYLADYKTNFALKGEVFNMENVIEEDGSSSIPGYFVSGVIGTDTRSIDPYVLIGAGAVKFPDTDSLLVGVGTGVEVTVLQGRIFDFYLAPEGLGGFIFFKEDGDGGFWVAQLRLLIGLRINPPKTPSPE